VTENSPEDKTLQSLQRDGANGKKFRKNHNPLSQQRWKKKVWGGGRAGREKKKEKAVTIGEEGVFEKGERTDNLLRKLKE